MSNTIKRVLKTQRKPCTLRAHADKIGEVLKLLVSSLPPASIREAFRAGAAK